MRFVLVHGACSGAWCFERLIPELVALGHEAVAVDLPGHGTRQSERSTLAGYRDAVTAALSPRDVLVGHSMGAAVVTLAADAFLDVAHVIYLAGPVPVEGRPMVESGGGRSADDESVLGLSGVESELDRYVRMTDDGEHWFVDAEGARAVWYHDVPPDTAAWVYERLVPQRADVISVEPISVPRFWNADLPRSLIAGDADRAFTPPYARLIADRLGVTPLTIAASHSPFLSRPRELARLMVRALDTEPIGPLKPT